MHEFESQGGAAKNLAGASLTVRHPQRLYFERLESHLKAGMNWLDVGCGRRLAPDWMPERSEIEERLKCRAARLVGIDLDLAALKDNTFCDYRMLAQATALPFESGSFDLVTSNMVFEHVEQPRSALAEIRRVMRVGAQLLVHTPNILDIVTVGARIIPNQFHPLLVSHLEGRDEEDVYPTHFRFNRRREVEAILQGTGFEACQIQYLNQPDTYRRVPVIGLIEALWHGIARQVPALRGTLLIEAIAK